MNLRTDSSPIVIPEILNVESPALSVAGSLIEALEEVKRQIAECAAHGFSVLGVSINSDPAYEDEYEFAPSHWRIDLLVDRD